MDAHALAESLSQGLRDADVPALAAAVARTREEALAAHPGHAKHVASFDARLSEVLHAAREKASTKAELVHAVTALRAADLLLAHAAGKGDPQAIAEVEKKHLRGIAGQRLRGQRFSSDEVAEVEQSLRELLFVARPGESPKIAQYTGRGDLGAWVSISATRAALKARKKTSREVSVDESGILARHVTPRDLELDFVKEAYRPAFKEAFHEALATLEDKERLLLKQHVVDGLSIDALGEIYGVHRATAARWIAKIREDLLARTREAFSARAKVGRAEFESLLRLARSQLDVSLRRVL